MFQKTTLLLLLLVIVSCKNNEATEKDQIKIANWLLGKWSAKTADGDLSENWKQLNDSTFQGESFFVKGKDTLHFESILLQQKEEKLFYNATVKGQNNDKPVTFSSTILTEKQLVFENPTHDYPQKISYTKGANNTLTAEISGNLLGKPSAEKFVMTKEQ